MSTGQETSERPLNIVKRLVLKWIIFILLGMLAWFFGYKKGTEDRLQPIKGASSEPSHRPKNTEPLRPS